MIYKERLSSVAFTFILISGLFLKSSLSNTDYSMLDEEDECLYESNEESYVVFLKNSSKKFCCLDPSSDKECDVHHHLPSTLRDFNFKKITCVMDMKHHLHCFWNITNLPENATYSADVYYENSHQNLNCRHIIKKEVECHGHVTQKEFKLEVNISLPTLLYSIGKMFETNTIVKLNPPDNIRISNNLNYLEINWTLSEENLNISNNMMCYTYQLKINGEDFTLPDGQSSYIKQDVDVTRKYAIQVRVKQNKKCGNNNYWSDWSSVHEVGPFENEYSVNPWVITVIALVLPMLLLAVLLICKCQRLPKKLFPPIPSPSVNVKNLLEKDNYILDLTSKCVYNNTEVVHTVEERNG